MGPSWQLPVRRGRNELHEQADTTRMLAVLVVSCLIGLFLGYHIGGFRPEAVLIAHGMDGVSNLR